MRHGHVFFTYTLLGIKTQMIWFLSKDSLKNSTKKSESISSNHFGHFLECVNQASSSYKMYPENNATVLINLWKLLSKPVKDKQF